MHRQLDRWCRSTQVRVGGSWGFPKIGASLSLRPYKKGQRILGSILGSPLFWETTSFWGEGGIPVIEGLGFADQVLVLSDYLDPFPAPSTK